ncbi:MAG: alpha-2-macroglobulin family protein, partial [Myxococcota bacterium]
TLQDAAAVTDQAYVEVGRRRPLRIRLDLPLGPHRSGSEVVAAVRVRGSPAGAHVVVRVAAPEALDAALAPQRDLFQFFHRYRPPSWHTHLRAGRFKQTPIVPVPVPAPSPAAVLAAGGAFMTDAARMSKKGVRKVSLTLPDRQGQLRVEAIVWSDERMGTASAEIEVRDPLAIDAAAPPVLTEGDSIELPVTIFRGQQGPAMVQLTALTKGGLEVVGEAGQPIQVPAGGQATAVVRIGATRDGEVTLQATAEVEPVEGQRRPRSAGPSVSWQRSVAVRAPAPPQVRGVGVQAGLDKPSVLSWPPVSGRSRVAIGSTPVFQLGAASTRLARADRDDLETVSARALARQVSPDLSRARGPGGTMPTVSGGWPANLDAVERCMGPDGPRQWPDGPPAAASSVVLAGHAVVWAARRNNISPNFDRWIDAVKAAGRSGSASARTVAYAQWVLALGRRPDEPLLEQLQTQWVNQPPDLATGAGLGAALRLVGRPRAAAPLLKFKDAAILDPADAAFVLAALADSEPDHPVVPELNSQLMTALSAAKISAKRTDALALVGLARLDAARKGRRPFWARLTLGDEELRQFKGPGQAVIGDFDDATRTRGELRLTVTGGAPVYGSVVVEGPPLSPAQSTVKVSLRLLDESGQSVEEAGIGDRLTLAVTVGPIGRDVSDLRVSIPVPSGLTVTKVEPPAPRVRVARDPGRIAFDLPATASSTLQMRLHASVAYAGNFALGPVMVSSALRPGQQGASEARRLVVRGSASRAAR